jgi:hypothetical protein
MARRPPPVDLTKGAPKLPALDLRCTGRPVDRYARVVGATCRRRYKGTELEARAAGWHLGKTADGTPEAMCPTCARPGATPRKALPRVDPEPRLFELGR